jgi:hypothetical protein
MKKLLIILVVVMTTCAAAKAPPPHEFGGGVSFGIFYSSLGSYGDWISVSGGVYAWRPRGIATGWRPYLYGHWLWSDEGWYWDSAEPWAWAAYHYGRWYYDDYYGWIWIPGYDWAPAWVEWRYGADYVGWAPLGPYAMFDMRFGITYRQSWVTPYDYWSFVDCRHVTALDVHRYVYRTDNNTRIIGRTRTAGSVRYDDGRIRSRGPDPQYVERRGNITLRRADIAEVGERQQQGVVRIGDRDRIDVYRPRIEDRGLVEKPDRVRESERAPSIDTRNIDLRSHQWVREGAPSSLQRRGETRTQEREQRVPSGELRSGALRRQFEVERHRSFPNNELRQATPRAIPERRIERVPEMRRQWQDRPAIRREAMPQRIERRNNPPVRNPDVGVRRAEQPRRQGRGVEAPRREGGRRGK